MTNRDLNYTNRMLATRTESDAGKHHFIHDSNKIQKTIYRRTTCPGCGSGKPNICSSPKGSVRYHKCPDCANTWSSPKSDAVSKSWLEE